jgi:hypothetical protein
MTGQVEHADGFRGIGTFPEWWGSVEGRGTSEERVNWVTRNVAMDQELERRGFNAAEFRGGKRTMSAHAALARVRRMQAETLP